MKKLVITFVLILVGLGALWQAGSMNEGIIELRREHHLNLTDPLENSPPLVAFTTIALGGFRGIFADWLWLRAGRLQEEGRYFELVQLAQWITQLEPRFAEVWAYHAWNLSYNVSVLFHDPADRWRWVNNGISLLRDRGIFYNPGDPEVYRELGWIFQHKIGQPYDQAHVFFKMAWAEEMSYLFDGRGPDYDTLLNQPQTEKQLLTDPDVRSLTEKLQQEGLSPFSATILNPSTMLTSTRRMLDSDAGRKLLTFVRGRTMREKYKLLPEVMVEIEERYGPLDWRLPQAHSLYWAYRGRQFTEEGGFERIATDRMIFQSMADAVRQGRLTVNGDEDLFVTSPKLALIPYALETYDHIVKQHPDVGSFKIAQANFMRDAIFILRNYQRVDEARALYDEFLRLYPDTAEKTLAEFMNYADQLIRERVQPSGILIPLEGTLYEACLLYAQGKERQARRAADRAKELWSGYMQEFGTNPELAERMGLPPLSKILISALAKARETVTTDEERERLGDAENFLLQQL